MTLGTDCQGLFLINPQANKTNHFNIIKKQSFNDQKNGYRMGVPATSKQHKTINSPHPWYKRQFIFNMTKQYKMLHSLYPWYKRQFIFFTDQTDDLPSKLHIPCSASSLLDSSRCSEVFQHYTFLQLASWQVVMLQQQRYLQSIG